MIRTGIIFVGVIAAVVGIAFYLAPQRTEPRPPMASKPKAIAKAVTVKEPETPQGVIPSAPAPQPKKEEKSEPVKPSPMPAVPPALEEGIPSMEETSMEEYDPIAMTAEEMKEMLGVSPEIARRIAEILGQRDQEAERVLTPYEGNLTREAIFQIHPWLSSLDERADREIEVLLTPKQVETYRRLRAEGFINGTAFEPPPEEDPAMDTPEPKD